VPLGWPATHGLCAIMQTMPYANREQQLNYMKTYSKDRRAKIRKVIEETKNVPCADCRQSYGTHVMQFDHVRGEKLLAIGSATARIKNLKALYEEIAKCEVVCANCHAERTYQRIQEGASG